MSRKVLRERVQRGGGSVLAALFGAWLHSLVARVDQRVNWLDLAVGAGFGVAWLLGRVSRK